MQKALVIKELRESAGIVALAVIAAVYMLAELTATPIVPWQSGRVYAIPFVRDGIAPNLWMLGGGLAIALGFRQTAWELSHGTYFFLLHRPVSRQVVFGVKLLVGLLLLMLVSGSLLALFAWWAMTPGHVDAPFFWSMTIPTWQQWVALPPIYFGAFLAGIRPGRWFGSRLLPLVAGILVAAVASSVPWLWTSVVISLLGSSLGVVAIFYYVRSRDY